VPNLDASGGQRWKIAIAARPALFSETLAAALVQQGYIEIAGRASDEANVLELVRRTRPAVLLLDEDGFGPSAGPTIRSLHRSAPGTRVLVLSAASSDDAVERVLRTGASGLVGKQESVATLVRAIEAVALGELWANRRATAHVIEVLSSPSSGAASDHEHLTSREWEIADAVGKGLRNKEIARRLKVSEKTVKSHLNNIFRKLQVDNRFAVGLYTLDRLGPKT
jgi:DNA-binding NarL/FixJ family response regulator